MDFNEAGSDIENTGTKKKQKDSNKAKSGNYGVSSSASGSMTWSGVNQNTNGILVSNQGVFNGANSLSSSGVGPKLLGKI
jgi:hypothetical protein